MTPTDGPRFRRLITFRPGYNYLHETGPKARGQHGMEISFTLQGPHGAVATGISTFWTPPGPVDEGRRELVHVDRWFPSMQTGPMPLIFPPSGTAVDTHWHAPLYDGQASRGGCAYVAGGPCYFDCSYSASDDILRDFIVKGTPAVWRALVGWYRQCLANEAEHREGRT